MGVFDILFEFRTAFLSGLEVTLKLSLIVWFLGLTFGVLLGVVSYRFKNIIGRSVKVISFILSGVPLLVFLYWAHYPLQVLLQINIEPFYTSLFILLVINIFGISNVVLNSLEDLPSEYITAGKVCGLSEFQIARYIQLPLITRQVLPSILNLQVLILQMTLFTSLISVDELFRVAQRINSSVHKPVEIYSALAIFFLAICLPLNGFSYWFKKKFTRRLSIQ